MHMPPSTPPPSSAQSPIGRRHVHEAPAKAALHGEHENVQRFRSLMQGKPPSAGNAGHAEDVTELAQPGEPRDDHADTVTGAPPQDQEQALRELLQRQLEEGRSQPSLLAPREQDGDGGSDRQDDHRGQDPAAANVGLQALHLAQQAMAPDAQPPAASAAALAPALAELIERHVKRLLVPETGSRSAAQAREIMITLKDGVLPATELWLSRTEGGWKLRADSRSDTAYRSLLEGAPQLIERFARNRLGVLEVDAHLLA
jgi:hypothetical protein